jgi:chromosome segregation ATPase
MQSPTRIEARQAELYRWDAYLERLQVKAATTAGSARQQAEAAISELRRQRNALGERLREVTSASVDGGSERQQSVEGARDELARRAAELEARLEPRGIV